MNLPREQERLEFIWQWLASNAHLDARKALCKIAYARWNKIQPVTDGDWAREAAARWAWDLFNDGSPRRAFDALFGAASEHGGMLILAFLAITRYLDSESASAAERDYQASLYRAPRSEIRDRIRLRAAELGWQPTARERDMMWRRMLDPRAQEIPKSFATLARAGWLPSSRMAPRVAQQLAQIRADSGCAPEDLAVLTRLALDLHAHSIPRSIPLRPGL